MAISLNEEQTRAVEHPPGSPAVLIAGAGSGKTACLQGRVIWLIKGGVPSEKILVVTFTNKATDEVKDRILKALPNVPAAFYPHVSNIHKIAMSCIRQSPGSFGLRSRVTPLDEHGQEQMFKKIVDGLVAKGEEKYDLINHWALAEKIGFHRARGLGFHIEYTPDYHQRTLKNHGGYHAMNEDELSVWRIYEAQKTIDGVVDFDDMLHLCVRRLRTDPAWLAELGQRFEHVLVDEAQDLSTVQWEFIEAHLASGNPNFYCVGDMNQCQPPGTSVKIVTVPPRGSKAAICEQRSIETLCDDERATTWDKHDQITYNAGHKIRVASRLYSGDLIRIATQENSTECTPSHWNWVRFNARTQGKHLVYLMYRSDLGFRVGISVFKRATGGGHMGAYGLSYRMRQEKAEAGWILRVCNTRPEAEAWEEIYSVKYGIPESLFEATVCWHKTKDLIRLVFQHANPEGGRRCLADHGLLEAHPIISPRGVSGYHSKSWRGFFKTVTANIIPELMDIPIEGRNKSAQIVSVSRRFYTGLVYSLNVEKNHTYIADGLVVGNSIYAFNGASPDILKRYSEGWRGTVPVMYRIERNHRSCPEIVRLANAISRRMTETIPLQMVSWRGLAGAKGLTKFTQAATPANLAEIMAREIYIGANRTQPPIPYGANAILVRAATQIRDIEGELVKYRIPYVVCGGKGLLNTEEVRDVVSFLKLAVNPYDYTAFSRAAGLIRGVGKATLRQVSDMTSPGKTSLLEAAFALEILRGFVAGIQAVQTAPDAWQAYGAVLEKAGYLRHLREKYGRDPGKLEYKMENLGRLSALIRSLAEGGASVEDVVFRLALEPQTDDPQGRVVISTIHKAKGLEWHRVYVTNLYEGSLPHQFSMGNPSEVEEERRLLYVACTRARDTLVLCIPDTVQPPGGPSRRVTVSRFLREMNILPS